MTILKPAVGVMGGAANSLKEGELDALGAKIQDLGSAIAARGCVLITGETSGIPGNVARVVAESGGLSIGISPAHSAQEHQERFGSPDQRSSDVVIYTGFGLKGRNVVNVRSCDIVLVVCGSMGTLNEFTIAYDEGKIIGVLEGSGGVADLVKGLVETLSKKTRSILIFDRDPKTLLDRCLAELGREKA